MTLRLRHPQACPSSRHPPRPLRRRQSPPVRAPSRRAAWKRSDPIPGVQPRGFDALGLGVPSREPLPFHTDLDSPLPFGHDYDVEHHEPMYLPLALSVGAGFKFGCGFMLAVAVSMFGLFLAASVIFFVAALAGLPVPGAMP